MERIVILGRGKVGRGLAAALSHAGVEVLLRSARRPRRAELAGATTVLLTVPDAAIVETTARIADALPAQTPILHCAGAQAPDVHRDAAAGRPVGSMHPLVSFAGPPPRLQDTTFTLGGDSKAVRAGRRIARAVGARALAQPIAGPAYHAAAAMVANGATGLAALGVELLIALGVEPRPAARAVGALLRSVGDNIEALGLPRALTGPVARGDARTVRGHRRALASHPRVLRGYDAIAPAILEVATAAGLAPARAKALRRALREPSRGQRSQPASRRTRP